MSYLVSLGTIKTRVLRRANLEGASEFISDSELADEINESIAEWWDIVRLTTWGGQYDREPHTFNTANGVASYDLPDDFLNLISVDVFFSANQVLSARPYPEEKRNAYRWYPAGWLFTQPVFYQLQGDAIVFIPVPVSAFKVTLNYVPTLSTLVDDGDTFDSVNGWEAWVVYDVAIKLLTKDGQTDIIAELEGRLAKQEARIRAVAAERDQGAAEVVHDVTTLYDDVELL